MSINREKLEKKFREEFEKVNDISKSEKEIIDLQHRFDKE